MDSEDELAAVIGHEIEHIDHYHCAERAQREQALRKLPLGTLVSLPVAVFTVGYSGYSKDQELEADREGTRLAVDAGYSATGAIRMFETFGRLYEEYEGKAKTPQEELSRVAQQSLDGYFRSHPLPSERIAQIQRMIAAEDWRAHPERDLAVGYIFWTTRAQKALEARQYAQAEHLATQSLRLRPDQPQALKALALAQFAQANFSGAAGAYRKILESDNLSHPEIVAAYAHALAASDRKSAPAEFQGWEQEVKGEKPYEVAVAAAGLALLAGDSGAAHKLELEFRQGGSAQAPVWIGELGWWHYLGGNFVEAVRLLTDAAQRRPGDSKLLVKLAWAEIEVRRYGDALQAVNSAVYETQLEPARAMVRAVARWQAQEQDQALLDFKAALGRQPEWENPNWVNALYSPLIAQSILEMQAERERRKLKAKIAAR
jgi:predicted Zn-dependent protease